MKLSVRLATVAAAIAVVLVVSTAHAADGDFKDIQGVETGTSTASPQEIAGAQPITPYLSGASTNEPDACLDTDGNPLTEFTEEVDRGVAEGNGLSVSPAAYEVTDLQPGVDYRLCVLIRNFSPQPAKVVVDDVDLRAAETADAGVTLIDQTNGVGTWVVPAKREFVAERGIVYKVPYVLRAPDKLPAGTVVGGVRIVRQAIDEPVQAAVTQRLYISSPGGARGKLKVEGLTSSTLITGKPGKAALNVKYTMRSPSDYLNSVTGELTVTGLGRKVASQKLSPTTLLPDGAERVRLRQDGLPWIGVYRPTITFETTNGTITKKLPLVWVLPPLLYTVLLVVALLIPVAYFILRWRRRRQEWMAYLEDEDGLGEDDHDGDPYA